MRDADRRDRVLETVRVNGRVSVARLASELGVTLEVKLVGKKTLEIAVRKGFVDPSCVLLIGGVPHAQMARMM